MGVVGWPVFEHREAFLTPLGGGTIAQSLIRTAHLAPCHDIRYSRCQTAPSRQVRPIRDHIWRSTRVGVVGWPVFEHREAFLTPLGGGTIAQSPNRTAHLAPCHDIRYSRCQTEPSRQVRPIQDHIWRSTRVGVFGWPVFEHREAFLTPLGGGTIARSLIQTAHLAPCHDIRYSRCQTEPSGASNPRTHLAVYTCGSGRLAGV